MNYSAVFKYRKTGIIVCCTLHKISLVEYFLTLNKVYKTVFVNLFAIKIDLLAFSLAICVTSTMLGGKILIVACSYSSIHVLVLTR